MRVMRRARWAIGIGSAIVALVAAREAAAGDYVRSTIVAATEDGAYDAEVGTSDGNLEPNSCGMRKVGEKDLLVHAECVDPGTTRPLLPFAKWKWIDPKPEVRRLKELDATGVDKMARIGGDDESGAAFFEVFHDRRWIRVREGDNAGPSITAVLKGPDRYVVRLNYTENLADWDKLWVVTFAEILDERGRADRTHKVAQDDTARMRAHRKAGDAIFAPPPAGTAKGKWEQRRRYGLARVLDKWVTAAVFRPLSMVELEDVLWLLGWFESPQRRYQALRWTDRVRRRDPAGVAAVIDELARDPDTKALADYLKTTKDWLRDLPFAGEEITSERLRGLSAEQLAWLRRSIQARAGYHFEDAAARDYLIGAGVYAPMSDRKWTKLTSDPAWKTDPDAVLLRALGTDERAKKNLAVIKEAEARQRAAPR